MLACVVAMRPRSPPIPAAVEETASASAAQSATVDWALLVDEAASASDTLDAAVGVFIVEAATAADSPNALADYTRAIDESVSVTATQDAELVGAPLDAFLPGGAVNADGTTRQAFLPGAAVNLG